MKTRRRFLTVLSAATVAAACSDGTETLGGVGGMATTTGAGGADVEPDLPEGYDELGNVTGLPVGVLLEAFGKDLLLGRDEAGVYAMTSRCTHQQCNMINNEGIIRPGVIRCACHGSEFNAVGVPIAGPANAPLDHFAVFIDDNGFIGVDVEQVVDASTRAAVPA